MARVVGNGKGESLATSMPKDWYFKELTPELIKVVVEQSCKYFTVIEPTDYYQYRSRSKVWKGWYYPTTKTVAYTHPYSGLIIHELAHHIAHEKHGRIKSHGHEFASVLQELYWLWEKL